MLGQKLQSLDARVSDLVISVIATAASTQCQSSMMADPIHLFSRSRCKLAPAAGAGVENVALKTAFQELEDSYSRNNSQFRKSRFVCNFSSNDLSLDDVSQFATWLESSSLRIYALDLSFNRIFSDTWEPILQVVGRIVARVGQSATGWQLFTCIE